MIELIQGFSRDALPSGGILAIHDDNVNALLLPQDRRMSLERPPARAPDDIAHQHDPQNISLPSPIEYHHMIAFPESHKPP